VLVNNIFIYAEKAEVRVNGKYIKVYDRKTIFEK